MSSFLYSLGRAAYTARKTVLVLWMLVLVATGGLALAFNNGLNNTVTIPGTESQEALDRLAITFPETSGASAQIIVVSPGEGDVHDPAVEEPVRQAVDELSAMEAVASAVSPYNEQFGGTVSDDGDAALVAVQLHGQTSAIDQSTKDRLAEITRSLDQRLPADARASHGGPLFSQEIPGASIVEALGLIFAVIVLTITLGSFLAAGMPLVNALIGVGVSVALIFLATAFTQVMATTPLLALMLGLAVGIDYALFIVSRHQQELADGVPPREAAARSVATAGSAVIFAGITVMIALVGLGVAGIPFLTTMGLAATLAVGLAVLVSLTLIPALLGFAGQRLRPRDRSRRRLRATTRNAPSERFFAGWVRAATRFPLATVLAVVAALGLVTAPAAGLRLALPDAGALPKDEPARITYDLVSEHLGPGYNGPLLVTGNIVTSTDPLQLMEDLKSEIERLDGVAEVPMATPDPDATTGIIQVIPEGAPDSEQTKQLVERIRALDEHFQQTYGVDISVTGFTALGIDVSEKLGEALLPFGVVVVGLSLVLLAMVFRSIAVPIKAALGYLLSIGVSLGVIALVFQDGYFAEFLNVAATGPVISFMPIVLMGVLFGLAMDYEVFLVSRIREEYVRTGDAHSSIHTGFVSSAKVVTAAAVIMFAVFAAFVPQGDANLKPIALGLAVGVFVDAFVVRMTLVPAVLALLGERAWWMPQYLDRILPSFDVEGENLREELELAEWPRPDSTDAVACAELSLVDPASGQRVYTDVGFTVTAGTAHVVRGAEESSVTALLLTLAGRLKPDGGKLKVLGFALPTRASSVRSRVAYVDVGSDGAAAVRRAIGESPELLVLDRTDRIPSPSERESVRRLLADSASTLTVITGTTGSSQVRELLPSDRPATLSDIRDDVPDLSGATR
ncbi:RND superfamily putative drug exporter [Halopolyspora algeriensis]|uniref:RND superfamily putative drug exporter n=1 Tax=Halopolyspora algeriensis TaxID=1500506 RepID=A0A368VU36_9ACTN|nr:MMPL family transporter [Halopolyspora algeriensis]RCW45331.1 RND superfamily putative drug exporter [Halopolyspora algeriensis]TQM47371.1 RND superfamily putative drug exporter [Halopolyspora algeriensis]